MTMPIASPGNPAIKRIRALRQRKEREESGLFFVEGIRLVGEALQLGAAIDTLVVAPELLTSAFAQDLVAAQARAGGRVLEVTAAVFQSLSQKEGPQGLGAVLRQRWQALDDLRADDGLGWVVLDAVADPGNLGTVLRTADAVGCAGVILLGNTTDPYDPAALRASMGAVFAQGLVRASWEAFAAWKQRRDYPLVGAAGAASADYQAVAYRTPLLLLMGSEREGLSAAQQAFCDYLVRIPMAGRSDSLNLAVATGVVLYEIFNQHRRSG